MKLYTKPGACSLSDHIALRWIGKPFDLQVMDAAGMKTPEYLALNPAGAVPVLEVDGWTLTQNAAILNFLADAFPESGLGGDGTPKSRAEINRWLAFLNADVHPAFHPIFGSTRFLGDEAMIEKSKDNARRKLRGLFERLDAQLAGKDWLTGARSIADPYLFVTLRWARATQVDLSGLDNLERFFDRMRADESVAAAMAAEGL
ncbi:glutathione S-transferase family protein [Pseudoxanthomonas sacheonensis]|uniref:glutathione S-transferase family protein n=1 Tax=Pseudoxanthomonas sacheonensis TaxID=443615 RepID=UPI0013D09E47|nr:glutathione binding-like protein [Pseudoxanthomonas sacheonensis]KAF1706745.1 glutathione S-transferase [Pseudoxanthomonas sacheonensis]